MDALEPEAGVAALNLLAEGHPVAKVEIGDGIEAGLERGEAFGGGFGARKLFMVERDAAVGVEHRHQRLVERSEEHTSELQSLMRISYAVFCLKTKQKQTSREK